MKMKVGLVLHTSQNRIIIDHGWSIIRLFIKFMEFSCS